MSEPQNVVLVTGASSGIGHAAALALAKAGFSVAATARRPETLTELVDAGCSAYQLDVVDDESTTNAIAAVERELGGVDVLVNNAGFGRMGAIEEMPLDAWRTQFETNVFGLVRLTQLVLPGMRARRRGRIINIGSAGGEMTFPLGGAYHATKYSVEALSDALRFELREFGIHVSIVQPGGVKTRLAADAAESIRAGPGSPYERLINGYGRVLRENYEKGRGVSAPEDVARTIVAAATAKQPRTRYKVGATAKAMPRIRRALPDRAWDGMLAAMFK